MSHKEDRHTFFKACRTGDLGTVRKSVESKAVGVNIQDDWDNSPLYLACLCGHPRVVVYLLQKGARYDADSIDGQRCFLSSLTNEIRAIMKDYNSSCMVVGQHEREKDFPQFLQMLYERIPDSDIQVVIAGLTFTAHRCILAVRCPYFYRHLCEDDTRKDSDNNTILIADSGLDAGGFRGVLQFIYTGQADIPKQYVAATIDMASYLGFHEFVETIRQEVTKIKDTADVETVHVQRSSFTSQLFGDFYRLLTGAVPLSLNDQLPVWDETFKEKRDYFTDVCFEVDKQLFECHKMFFYGRSDYFRTRLIDCMSDLPPVYGNYRTSVRLTDMSADMFVQIVSFVYMDICEITPENCLGLLVLSERLVLPGLKKQCISAVMKHMNNECVTEVFKVARDSGLPKIQQQCQEYMADHLEELVLLQHFKRFVFCELSATGKAQEANELNHEELLEDLQYYIRARCQQHNEKLTANIKLSALEDLLKELGFQMKLPKFDIGARQTTRVVTGWNRRDLALGRGRATGDSQQRQSSEANRHQKCIIL